MVVQDGTGEKEGTFFFFTISLLVMAKPGENNASQSKLLQIFYILYGYMVNKNLASLSFILSSKSIRDFFKKREWDSREEYHIYRLLLTNLMTIPNFHPPLEKTHFITTIFSHSCVSRVSLWKLFAKSMCS